MDTYNDNNFNSNFSDNRELESAEPTDIRQAFEDFTETLTGPSDDQKELMQWIGISLNHDAKIISDVKAEMKTLGNKDYFINKLTKLRL